MGRVWLIAGPTASGKSELAIRLAERLGGEVVNADSMQLYADLAVLTARPTAGDAARAPHHLYGVADAGERWSAGRWLRAAVPVLEEIAARGRPAVVVGGTGLYFRALVRGLAEVPAIPDAARAAAQAAYDADGEAAFRNALRPLDPEAEARIAAGDRQRLVRAMEVAQATGRSLTSWQGETGSAAGAAPVAPGAWRGVVMEPPRADLCARCDARLGAMVEGGALEEVGALAARGLDPEAPAMKALGVRELAAHLRGELSLDQALERARRETRRYAKRQSTWFRNQMDDRNGDWLRIRVADAAGQWRALQSLLAALDDGRA